MQSGKSLPRTVLALIHDVEKGNLIIASAVQLVWHDYTVLIDGDWRLLLEGGGEGIIHCRISRKCKPSLGVCSFTFVVLADAPSIGVPLLYNIYIHKTEVALGCVRGAVHVNDGLVVVRPRPRFFHPLATNIHHNGLVVLYSYHHYPIDGPSRSSVTRAGYGFHRTPLLRRAV